MIFLRFLLLGALSYPSLVPARASPAVNNQDGSSTTSEAIISPQAPVTIPSTSCAMNCTRSMVVGATYSWAPYPVNTTITYATVITHVDAANHTSITTEFETELGGYTVPTNINAAGTQTDTVWAYEPALGTTATFTVTYPTLHVNYDEMAHWQGVMPARSGNSSQCLSAGPGMAADSIFPSHPLPPQPTGGVVDNADPRGWHYRMVVQKFFDYTAITDVFPTFAPLSCVHDTRPPAAAAEPVSTAMFVTVSTTSRISSLFGGNALKAAAPSQTAEPFPSIQPPPAPIPTTAPALSSALPPSSATPLSNAPPPSSAAAVASGQVAPPSVTSLAAPTVVSNQGPPASSVIAPPPQSVPMASSSITNIPPPQPPSSINTQPQSVGTQATAVISNPPTDAALSPQQASIVTASSRVGNTINQGGTAQEDSRPAISVIPSVPTAGSPPPAPSNALGLFIASGFGIQPLPGSTAPGSVAAPQGSAVTAQPPNAALPVSQASLSLSPPNTAPVNTAPILDVGISRITANVPTQAQATAAFNVGGQSISAGGPAITAAGNTIQIATGGSAALINGVPVSLQAAPIDSNTIGAASVLSAGGMAFTAHQPTGVAGAPVFGIAGQTASAGGPAITAGGNTVSVATDGSSAVVNGVVQSIQQARPYASADSQSAQPGSPPRVPLAFGTSQVTPDSQGSYVVAGQTLIPGQAATISGTTVLLASNGQSAAIGSSVQTFQSGTVQAAASSVDIVSVPTSPASRSSGPFATPNASNTLPLARPTTTSTTATAGAPTVKLCVLRAALAVLLSAIVF